MTRPLLVLTTLETRDDAAKVIEALLGEDLIACGTILPGAESIYRWEGKIERTGEVMVLLKSTENRLNMLRARLLESHPYQVPEFIALSPKEVSPAYLGWLHECCEVRTICRASVSDATDPPGVWHRRPTKNDVRLRHFSPAQFQVRIDVAFQIGMLAARPHFRRGKGDHGGVVGGERGR